MSGQLVIIPMLETAENRLDPARADLGACDVHRRSVMQRGVRAFQPFIREVAVAEHRTGVVRDTRDREHRDGRFLLSGHEQILRRENGEVMIKSVMSFVRQFKVR